MNFNMNIPGLNDVEVEKIEETRNRTALYVSLPEKRHSCPTCLKTTPKFHDYRTQKSEHLKWFERLTV